MSAVAISFGSEGLDVLVERVEAAIRRRDRAGVVSARAAFCTATRTMHDELHELERMVADEVEQFFWRVEE